jgi:radical SAM protein with 4Fe4S-binding SPASM domain
VRREASEGRAVIDGLPLKVTLELTADCNLFCRHCEFPAPREEGREKNYELHTPFEDYRNLIVPALFPQARIVNPTVVGEPLMTPYLDELLEDCDRYQVGLEINTNGMPLDEATIRKVGPRTAHMVVSFDGGVRRTFNRIRTGGEFNVVTRNMALFDRWRRFERKEGRFPGLYMATTLLRDNIEELPTMIEIASLLRVDQLRASWMIAFTERLQAASCLRHRALTNACLRAARKKAKELGVLAQLPVELPGPSEAEIEAATPNYPVLPEGPLPHLRELIAARDADEAAWREAVEISATKTKSASTRFVAPQTTAPAPKATGVDETFIPLSEVGGVSPVAEGLRQSPAERAMQKAGPGFIAAEPSLSGSTPDGKPRYACKFLWNELFVNVSGDVAPCCTQGRPVVGNLKTQKIEEIWNGPIMQEMRRRLYEGDPMPVCRDCNYNTQLGHGTPKDETYFVKLDRKL